MRGVASREVGAPGRRGMSVLAQAVLAALLMAAGPASALENGLARRPPMGWNTFNCWGGDYDARKIKDIADALVLSGLRDLGYQYVNLDGGWNARGGSWEPDLRRFPGGIPPLAEYVHSKGLKLGIYIDDGKGREKALADKFASWGVDFLKHDAWTTPSSDSAWAAMREALSATGRPIFYSIHTGGGDGSPELANMWRTSGDIDPDWRAWTGCLNSVTKGGGRPGGWPDPDMLEVGNGMDDPNEEMAHFSLWCVISAPLIMGNDARAMFSYVLYILGNTEAIAVNQDTAFNDQKRVLTRPDGGEVWAKTLKGGEKAVVLFNKTRAAATLSVSWDEIGLPPGVAQVRDLWQHANLGAFTDRYSASVPAHGCAFVRIVSGSSPIPEPPACWIPKPPALKIAPLDRSGWTISASPATFYDQAKGDPKRLIDGRVDTSYSIEPSGESGHWVMVDMKSPQTFNAVVCDGHRYGPKVPPYQSYSMAHRWEVYTSDDGAAWGSPVAAGMWGPDAKTALMSFPTRTARYVKVVYVRTAGADGRDSQDQGGWCAGVDELYLANVEVATH